MAWIDECRDQRGIECATAASWSWETGNEEESLEADPWALYTQSRRSLMLPVHHSRCQKKQLRNEKSCAAELEAHCTQWSVETDAITVIFAEWG